MSDAAHIRASDAEREQLAGELREHLLAGRLTSAEFEERVDRAYHASTRADLDALRADLPMSPAVLNAELAKRRATLRGRLVREGEGAVGASAVAVGVWAASGADGSFWPIWVILATAVPVIRNGWRLLGPEPDLEAVEARLNARRQRRLRRAARHSGQRGLPR